MEKITEKIQGFEGLQYLYYTDPDGRKAYDTVNVEYATSTHQKDHRMFPGLIALPKNDDDIVKAVKHAKARKYAVSVMSGGHQYSGACSTDQNGIQLNLKSTYTGEQHRRVLPPLAAPHSDKTLVYVSVSHSLGEFNDFLQENKLFVPHGQCAYVRLGGHAQTGGYGQLGRSFGLLGDHIWGIRMIDSDGKIQEVTKASNPELFYAILGGSPGNFGVITHYTIEVYRDADYYFPGTGPGTELGPHGYKGVWVYNEKVVKQLLNEVAVMADDKEFPRNFDLCVTVLSRSYNLSKLIPEWEDNQAQICKHMGEILGEQIDASNLPAVVVLYAQWVPMNADDKYTDKVDAWFKKFRDLKQFRVWKRELHEHMSAMTGEWLFRGYREFNHPYDKRTYMTNSRTLVQDKWVDQVADQIDQVLAPWGKHHDLWKNCFLSCQIQCFGGEYSQYYANRNNGTAYSWRDSTVCQVLDCFYIEGEKGKALAKGWQDANDKLMCGENSRFSKQDKRVLWGSYGDWNMDKVWPFYFENRAKYERIGRQRHAADGQGTFTPNPFNVKAVAD